MLRAPRALKTHATRPPAGAATSSSGYGALRSCASEAADCWALSAAGTKPRRVSRRSNPIMGNLYRYKGNAYGYLGFNLAAPGDSTKPHPLFGDRELRPS